MSNYPFALNPSKGKYEYITTQDIYWDVLWEGSNLSIKIPKGFEFQASVPKYLRWLQNPNDAQIRLAACVHDYLLLEKKCDRNGAANEFRRCCIYQGVGPFWAWLLYLAISVKTSFFGGKK